MSQDTNQPDNGGRHDEQGSGSSYVSTARPGERDPVLGPDGAAAVVFAALPDSADRLTMRDCLDWIMGAGVERDEVVMVSDGGGNDDEVEGLLVNVDAAVLEPVRADDVEGWVNLLEDIAISIGLNDGIQVRWVTPEEWTRLSDGESRWTARTTAAWDRWKAEFWPRMEGSGE